MTFSVKSFSIKVLTAFSQDISHSPNTSYFSNHFKPRRIPGGPEEMILPEHNSPFPQLKRALLTREELRGCTVHDGCQKRSAWSHLHSPHEQREVSAPMPTTHASWNPGKPRVKALSFFSFKQLLVSQWIQGMLEKTPILKTLGFDSQVFDWKANAQDLTVPHTLKQHPAV